MPKAVWNDRVIAESDDVQVVDGYTYFPPESIDRDLLRDTATHTVCPWKGTASYFDIVVAGETNRDAAWVYPEASPEARHLQGHIGFWRGVTIQP